MTDKPIACSYGDNGYACCEGGPCQADVHNDKLAEQQAPAGAGMARLPSGSEVFARTRDFYPDATPVYTHPSPQEGMARWQPIETAPKDGQAILVTDGSYRYCVEWSEEFDWWTVDDNKLGPFRLRGSAPTHWMPLPPPPASAEGVEHG